MRPQLINDAKLGSLFRKEFELCNVKAGETIAVLSDLSTRRNYVEAVFAAAAELGADVYQMCVNQVPSWHRVGVETVGACKGTVDALAAADMLVALHIPLFTKWRKGGRAGGLQWLYVETLGQAPTARGFHAAVPATRGGTSSGKSIAGSAS